MVSHAFALLSCSSSQSPSSCPTWVVTAVRLMTPQGIVTWLLGLRDIRYDRSYGASWEESLERRARSGCQDGARVPWEQLKQFTGKKYKASNFCF